MKVCPICNKEFKAQRRTAIYCGAECKKQAVKIRDANRRGKEIIKDCPVCGKRFEIGKDGAKNKYCSEDCFKEARRIANKERWRRENPGWDDGRNKTCKECGLNFIDDSNTKHAKFCSSACAQKAFYKEHSERQTWDKHLESIKESAERAKFAKAIAAAEKRFFSYRAAKCTECGRVFGTYQPSQKTCSPECSKRRKCRRNDKRLNHTNIVDKDITLATLYKRDKGICYICGDQCDYEDYTRDGNNVTVGITYPTIDHLIPLTRGGKHAWDNVRLAHHHCNSVKSDTLPEDIKDLIPEEAYILARKVSTQRKQVKQFTKEGRLIATYESTVEAARQTGLQSKGIQNCARGERPSQGGFLWSY